MRYINKSGVDIWGLTEIKGTNGKQILEGLKDKYPYQTQRVGDGCANTSGACNPLSIFADGGVGIASKYPIEESYQHVFTDYAPLSPDVLQNKGVTLAKLNVNGHPLWVATMHTQADDTLDDEISDTNGIRQDQAEEARKFIANHVPKGDPIVLTSDANVPYFSGMNPSKLDSDGRSQIEQLAKNLDMKIPDMSKQPFSYDGPENPLASNRAEQDTYDIFGVNDMAKLKDAKVIPVPSEESPSDHYPIKTIVQWDPRDPGVKPGQVAHYDITPNLFERTWYFVKNTASFAVRFAFKKFMQAAAFMAKTAGDAAYFVSRIINAISPVAYVAKIAGDAAYSVSHAIDATYHAVLGLPSSDADKSAAEIKKTLNDKKAGSNKKTDKAPDSDANGHQKPDAPELAKTALTKFAQSMPAQIDGPQHQTATGTTHTALTRDPAERGKKETTTNTETGATATASEHGATLKTGDSSTGSVGPNSTQSEKPPAQTRSGRVVLSNHGLDTTATTHSPLARTSPTTDTSKDPTVKTEARNGSAATAKDSVGKTGAINQKPTDSGTNHTTTTTGSKAKAPQGPTAATTHSPHSSTGTTK
ncbi:Sphingomyelinase C precursor [Mycobacteroides abscessus subsp. bolletii]|nr:Sphingomyelinase C precursor [Mycobacteroides abscessus subsp. bolletii]